MMACISNNVRPLTSRLMAAAFTPPTTQYASTTARRVGSISRGCASLPSLFDSPCSSHGQTSFARSIPFSSTHQDTRLHSTTPDNSDDIATSSDNVIRAEEEEEGVDPYSDEARDDLAKFYQQNGILDTTAEDIDTTHKSLLRLTEQVLDWNQRLNLVSRKDCTVSVIYHKHILPSVALLPFILETTSQQSQSNKPMNIIDVGTGGGFPGLPLALLLPEVQFTLVDSVQKKLKAVSEMAAELDMTNIRIHWGRVEEMYVGEKGRREHRGRYDVVLGRSVTALPKFCGWVSDLLKKKSKGKGSNDDDEVVEEQGGRLIYIIGGELDELVESKIVEDISIDRILQRPEGTSDKRALIFHAKDVEEIATESGEKSKIVRQGVPLGNTKKNGNNKGGKKMAKGAWSKKENSVKKQRGYEDFQRFEA
eukprot:CAMPEP_0201916788 /NCGR_PEP_ID=MMETSP0903-20130614/6351_1 /ASSEMBLY_ACC=CAM_ASM_000552 /TAXON_ID=420261 /ORGANISM="Thalassiosira antarctica, Strain CCMP982" /LENGTH=421 /DNA_ID=CAMNT_0048452711 /DNA_START=177 /DNA_END=1442 /DNA_ORIENTATION=+